MWTKCGESYRIVFISFCGVLAGLASDAVAERCIFCHLAWQVLAHAPVATKHPFNTARLLGRDFPHFDRCQNTVMFELWLLASSVASVAQHAGALCNMCYTSSRCTAVYQDWLH